MKTLTLLCSTLLLPAAICLGVETNSVPLTTTARIPESSKAVDTTKSNASVTSAEPATPVVTPADDKQVALTVKTASRKDKLVSKDVNKSGRDYRNMAEAIFRSDNDQMGDASVRDTYLTLFPSR